MNLLLLLSALKKSWEVIKKVLAFAWEYKYAVIIAILLFINTQLRNDIVSLNSDKVKLNNDIVLLVQKQKQDLLEAEKKAQEQQIEILSKQKIVEEKYAKQVKDLSSDIADATTINNSLSKQLTSNTEKLSRVTEEQARAYNKSLSIVLEDSATRYREMAGEADTKRLAEERCIGLYNALVDVADDTDNPDTNNKE